MPPTKKPSKPQQPNTPTHPDDLLSAFAADVTPSPAVSPDLWTQLYLLTLTWQLRQARGLVVIPPSLDDELWAREGWQWEYEARFGDPSPEGGQAISRLKDRLIDFISRVNTLAERGIDLQALYVILEEARQHALEAALRGRGIDWSRS